MIEQENNQRLLKSRVQVPDKIEVDGAMRIPCHLYPDCKTVFIKALGWFSYKIFIFEHYSVNRKKLFHVKFHLLRFTLYCRLHDSRKPS